MKGVAMPRKSVADLKTKDRLVKDAVAGFKNASDVKYELAKDAYEMQDTETQRAIDRIVDTLRTYATGFIEVQLQPPTGAVVPVKIDAKYLGYNLLFLAVEVAKDLAFVDIRLAGFKFPEGHCVSCGAELHGETRTTNKRGRRG
jgi:hypothetical protein